MSNTINTKLAETLWELIEFLPPTEAQEGRDLLKAGDLEGVYAFNLKHIGQYNKSADCRHGGYYIKQGDDMHCAGCDKYLGNQADVDEA